VADIKLYAETHRAIRQFSDIDLLSLQLDGDVSATPFLASWTPSRMRKKATSALSLNALMLEANFS